MLEIYRLLTEHNIIMCIQPNGKDLLRLELAKDKYRFVVHIDLGYQSKYDCDVSNDIVIHYLRQFINEHRKWWIADGSDS